MPNATQSIVPTSYVEPVSFTESEILAIFGPLERPKIAIQEAVIKAAASAASPQGGCASSRLDHGLKFYVIQGGCASSRLINEFSDSVVTGTLPGTHELSESENS